MSRSCRVFVLHAAMWAALPSAVAAQEQPRFDLQVEVQQLSFEELSRLVPALAQVTLPPDFKITRLQAEGPLERLAIELVAESRDSAIRAQAVVDAREPGRSARGSTSLRGVDLAALLQREALPTDVTADAVFNLQFGGEDGTAMQGTFGLEAPRLAFAGYQAGAIRLQGRIDGSDLRFDASMNAYGAALSAEGQATLGDALRYEVRGRARHVDLRRLPPALEVPELASRLDVSYRVSDMGQGLRGRVELGPSQLAGARIAGGTVATIAQRGDELHYDVNGGLSDLDLRQLGRAFDVDALAAERLESDIDARFRLRGRGARLDPAELTITDSTLFGGRVPRMQVRVAMSDDALRFTADGRFEDWNAGVLMEREEVTGTLSGDLDVEGRLPRAGETWQTDRLDVQGRLTLAPSSIEGIQIEGATLAGRLVEGGLVQLEQFEITGDGLALRAHGQVGIDPSRPTSVEYFIDTPPLGAVADVIGADVEGDLTLEGRITGQQVLDIAGSLSGTGLAYGDYRTAELSGTYAVALPRANPAGATGEVQTTASDVELGAQAFEELTAKATYDGGRIGFDTALTRADDLIQLAGQLDWQTDRQQVQLTGLRFRTGEVDWQLASGSRPTVEYGGEGLAVSDLRLVSGPDQQLSADGAIGPGGGALRVDLANVAIAPFAAMAGREDLRGRLTAGATIGGTMDEPTVQATFTLADAAVQNIDLRTVEGRVDLGGEDLSFDARLERPDASWLRAEGRVPAALVRDREAALQGPIDVTVESSPIALDTVRAFTTELEDVEGTLQLDARVTGTLDDPRPDGQIRISGGAFAVPRLGTRYPQLEASIAFRPDAVAIEQFRLVDDDGDHVTVSGRLPMEKLRIGNVDLDLSTNGLEVIDNELGDVEIAAELKVEGELTAPRVTGDIEVTEGTLNIDQILDLGDDTYAVRAAEQGLLTAEEGEEVLEDEGLLAGVPVALDVSLDVPTLLLRGQDIQGPGASSMGLGSVNLTANGELDLQKTVEGPLRINGTIEMVRGTYEFQGREFTLARGGSVRFAGLPEINPMLDVTAQREISAVETQVHVGGTLDQPTLELSSSPPLDEADILSLIVFNQPVNSLGTGEQVSLAGRAGALASGFAARQLTDAVGGVMDVDLLEIEAAGNNGLAPGVTIGEQFGDLFVKLQQQFGAQSTSRVVVEYSLTDWLRIESSFVEDQSTIQPLLRRQEDSGVDAVISFEY